MEDGFALGATSIREKEFAEPSGSVGHDRIHDDVMTLNRNVIELLKRKAKAEFERVCRATGEKAIEKSSAAAEAMTITGKGEAGHEDEIDRIREMQGPPHSSDSAGCLCRWLYARRSRVSAD